MLYHATNTHALAKILEAGEMHPANRNPIEGAKNILRDYVTADRVTDELASSVIKSIPYTPFTIIQQGTQRKGSVYFYPEIEQLVSQNEKPLPSDIFISKYLEVGGEFGNDIKIGLERATGIKVEPRFKGTQSVILEVDIPIEKTDYGIGGEVAYQGKIPVELIKQVHLLNEQGKIINSMSLEQAQEYCQKNTKEKPSLISNLGKLEHLEHFSQEKEQEKREEIKNNLDKQPWKFTMEDTRIVMYLNTSDFEETMCEEIIETIQKKGFHPVIDTIKGSFSNIYSGDRCFKLFDDEAIKFGKEMHIIKETKEAEDTKENDNLNEIKTDVFSAKLNWGKMDSPQHGIVLRMDASNFDGRERIEMIEALQLEGFSPIVAYSRTFNKEYFQLSGDDVTKFTTLNEQKNIQSKLEQITLLENINNYWKKFDSSDYGIVLRFDTSNFDTDNLEAPSEFTKQLREEGFNATLIKNHKSNKEYIQISGDDAQKFENILRKTHKQKPVNKSYITPSM